MLKEQSNYNGIPAMNSSCVHDFLKKIGHSWQGLGTVVEVGAWLGGSAMPLLEGLKAVGYNDFYWAFDRWKADVAEAKKAEKQGVLITEGENLMPRFFQNLSGIHSKFSTARGEIEEKIGCYEGGPIEICLLDAPKTDPLFTHVLLTLARFFIPQVTVIGMMDYYFYREKQNPDPYKAAENFVKCHPSCFLQTAEFGEESSAVFFKYLGGL